MRHVSRWFLLGLAFLLVTGSQAADVPNLRGSYEGTFVNATSHSFQAALLRCVRFGGLINDAAAHARRFAPAIEPRLRRARDGEWRLRYRSPAR